MKGQPNNRPFIVGFLYAYLFPKRPNMKELIDNGIIRDVNSAPRGFEPIREEQFARSSDSPKPTHALLSIKPQYAEAIFDGRKRFEFRRTIFRKPVDTVVVYVTSPTCLVAGEFEVAEIVSDSVGEDLWRRTSKHAGIDRECFFDYFEGCELGYAISIGCVRRYKKPLDLSLNFGIRAPQSFVYI